MNIRNVFFNKQVDGDLVEIVDLVPSKDCSLIHEWVTKPYAKFWGLLDSSVEDVLALYEDIDLSDSKHAYIGMFNGSPAFVLETYNPKCHEISDHYEFVDGDLGMHVLIAPCDRKVSGFTRQVFSYVMEFLFNGENVSRVVVEPDIRNSKIHTLNKEFGFFHAKKIRLSDKESFLGFCTYEQYLNSEYFAKGLKSAICFSPTHAVAGDSNFLNESAWWDVNRILVRKMICEFSHERLLFPKLLSSDDDNTYLLLSDDVRVAYQFKAKIMALSHWVICLDSITRVVDGESLNIDAVEFILEFNQRLNISPEILPTYIDEITSTLWSRAFKHSKNDDVARLVDGSFQDIEIAMMEGHPTFVANNGRMGFNESDFYSYAPESGAKVYVVWLALSKTRASFSSVSDVDYRALIDSELDVTTREEFSSRLAGLVDDPNDYLWIPVHPWQWENKISSGFASDIATGNIVYLGVGDDGYFAQQSIRTFFNTQQPKKYYVKTALSILNMGFMRGLSSYYMKTTPAINQWLEKLIESDDVLVDKKFEILREVAAVGYRRQYYENDYIAKSQHNKMLAALWRENPLTRISSDQRLMSMAALLHVDARDNAFLTELILLSEVSPRQWLSKYLDVYLVPLLHCFYKYGLVFMPHGENIILGLEKNVPVRIFMKDIGEEICLLNCSEDLPDDIRRIAVSVPESVELLSIFTDVFDGFFRYLSQIFDSYVGLEEAVFWRCVAEAVIRYQRSQPSLKSRFEKYDIFSSEFGLSCLNRLQLANNRQMVDLTDPATSLKFAGNLRNPISPYILKDSTEVAHEITKV